MPKDCYIGLDLGKTSVGICATDENYNVIKLNNKKMWDARIFDEASTAKDRRLFRGGRRRNERKLKRIKLLREQIGDKVLEKDKYFFERLDNSRIHKCEEKKDDKGNFTGKLDKTKILDNFKNIGYFSLFNDEKFTDKDFYKRFPTIYHLRAFLCQPNCDEKDKDLFKDPRLYYLAIEHILKNRGNFLYEGKSEEQIKNPDFREEFDKINKIIDEIQYEGDEEKQFDCFKFNEDGAIQKITDILKDSDNNKKDMKAKIKKLLDISNKKSYTYELFDSFLSGTFKIDKETKIDFSKEEPFADIELIDEKIKQILEIAIQIYSKWIWIQKIDISKNQTISNVFIDHFKKHYLWREKFQGFVKNNEDMKKYYDEIFNDEYEKNVNDSNDEIQEEQDDSTETKKDDENEKNLLSLSKIIQNYSKNKYDTIKKLTAILKSLDIKKTSEYQYSHDFCQKNRTNSIGKFILSDIFNFEENGKFESIKQDYFSLHQYNKYLNLPYQYHLIELKIILENFKNNCQINSEIVEQVKSIFTFRMPYYIGITSENKNNTMFDKIDKERRKPWVKFMPGKENERILPWNWKEIIDEKQTALNFIERMVLKDIYFNKEVLPKESLSYQLLNVHNWLNNLIYKNFPKKSDLSNDEKIKLKEEIIKYSYKEGNKVSKKSLNEWFKNKYPGRKIDMMLQTKNIDGEDETVVLCNLSTVKKIGFLFGNNFDEILRNREKIDNIVKIFTALPTPKMAAELTIEKYPEFKKHETELMKLNFSGWGRYSDFFLQTKIEKHGSGVIKTIFNWVVEDIYSLNQVIMTDNFNFKEKIKSTVYNSLEDFYEKHGFIPPWLRRTFTQAVKIFDNYKKILESSDYKIKNVFIESTKGADDSKKGKSQDPRWKVIENILKEAEKKNDGKNSFFDKKITPKDKKEINEKIHLYYLQNGKDLYTGKPIEITDLKNYEVDHIVPQSQYVDNSLDNKVLTHRDNNQNKKNTYPLSDWNKNLPTKLWEHFKNIGLISSKKYENLTRTEKISNDEKTKFINRDLVQVSWVVEILSDYLSKSIIKDNDTIITQTKAKIASRFRNHFIEWPKCRDLDDLHHAEDAYFNIIAGNIFYNKIGSQVKKFYSKDNKMQEEFWNKYKSGKHILETMFEQEIKDKEKILDNLKDRISIHLSYKESHNGNNIFDKISFLRKGEANLNIKKELDADKYGGYKSLGMYGYCKILLKENKTNEDVKMLFPISYVDIYKKFGYDCFDKITPDKANKFIEELFSKTKNILKYTFNKIITRFVGLKSIVFSKDGNIRYFIGGKTGERFCLTKVKKIQADDEYECKCFALNLETILNSKNKLQFTDEQIKKIEENNIYKNLKDTHQDIRFNVEWIKKFRIDFEKEYKTNAKNDSMLSPKLVII